MLYEYRENWGVLLVIAGVLSGCGPEHDHKGKTPLVEVAGEYLYKEDLQAALPFNISKMIVSCLPNTI